MDNKTKHREGAGAVELSDKALLWTVVINLALSVFEFAAGLIAGSVALMADALHNTNDAAALLIAWIARKISQRKEDEDFTFGYRRAELIAALIQLTALIIVGLFLIYEAVKRIISPEPLLGEWIIAAAAVAVVVDIVSAWILWAMSRGSLNIKAAFLHNLTDAGASIAVLIGGAAIYWLNWTWVDPVLSLLIASYIIVLAITMLRRTAGILMEGTPADISLHEVKQTIESVENVKSIHHLHVWELDETNRALEAHLVVNQFDDGESYSRVKSRVKKLLKKKHSIAHSILEIDIGQPDADEEQDMIVSH